MSKNNDRYKEDYTQLDIDVLEEINPQRFEKFKSKKKNKKAKEKSGANRQDDRSE
jgi:hypothetical protein